MGYEQRGPSTSSGTLVAVLVAGLLVAVLAVIVVGGAAVFWLRANTLRSEAMVAEHYREEAKALTAQQSVVAAVSDARLSFEVDVDREGNTSVNGEIIGLVELKHRLAKQQEETHNAFSVRIHADSECPVKHLAPVLAVCDEIGDIDYRVVAFTGSNPSTSVGK